MGDNILNFSAAYYTDNNSVARIQGSIKTIELPRQEQENLKATAGIHFFFAAGMAQ